MTNVPKSKKAKLANRVIEVFEFFAREDRPATVADLVAHFGRPQSSTSELLRSMVDIGILYRDAQTRTYIPTPRLAALGAAMQPKPIGSGRLFDFMDRLAQTTRCGVGLFGMVGTSVQVLRWADSRGRTPKAVHCGARAPLTSSVAGALLLSTMDSEAVKGLLWRLHYEVEAKERFDLAMMGEYVAHCGETGHAAGPSGFLLGKQMTAVLLPREFGARGLVMGVVHDALVTIDPDAILATLSRGLDQCVQAGSDENAFISAIAGPGRQGGEPSAPDLAADALPAPETRGMSSR